MSDEDVVGLNIPTGIPLRYDLDADLQPEGHRRHLPGPRGGRRRRGRRGESGREIVDRIIDFCGEQLGEREPEHLRLAV